MRERILDTFKKLAYIKGFHASTVDELSSRAGISKRTVYRYFKSKEEMVTAVVQDIVRSTEAEYDMILSLDEKPPLQFRRLLNIVTSRLNIISPAMMRDIQKYYPHIWKMIEEYRTNKVKSVTKKMITDNKDYLRDINPVIFSNALLASINSIVNPKFILENNLTVEETITSLLNIFLYGILSDEARKS